MTQSIPLKIKVRDIAIGFFGWVIISNLLFLPSIYLVSEADLNIGDELFGLIISLIMWLSAIIAILVLFIKKRIWICTGIVVNVVINAGFWVVTLHGLLRTLGEIIANTGSPLPIGLFFIFTS